MAVACTWDSGTITAGRAGSASCSGIVSPTLMDWLAIHRVGAPDGDLIAWTFVQDLPDPISLEPGQHGASRALGIPASTPAGSHTVRLYRGHSGILLAESAAFTINAYDNVIVLTGPASVSVNAPVTATFSGIPASLIGNLGLGLFFVPGDEYTTPLVTALVGGATSGTVDLFIPNATIPGTYRLRLYYAGEQYPHWYIESADITVTTTAQATIASPGDQLAGTLVQAQWANIVSPAPSTQDWVGLFALGAPASAPLGNRYLNGTASGSLPFVIPGYLPTDTYELRLYSGTDQALLATSDPFTVTGAP